MKDYFKQQWTKFGTWITAHGGPTKVGAAVILILGIAYGSVPEFHDFCVQVWASFPTKAKTLLVTAFTLYSWMRNPATKKIVDGILGPGDSATVANPVLSPDGTITGTSATVVKATELVASADTPVSHFETPAPPDLTSPLIVPKIKS